VRNIARNEGGIRAFSRGLGPNIVGNSISWALYFVWYDRIKHGIQDYRGPRTGLSYYDFFIASGAAGKFLSPAPIIIHFIEADYTSRDLDGLMHKSHLGN